jgi:hypothetical protein
MNKIISGILYASHTQRTNLSPTILYNEGWMIRILVAASIESGIKLPGVDFSCINYWYSEGLLSSPFLRSNNKLAEGYTHADMAIGNFEVGHDGKGDLKVIGKTGIFGVIEAKMGSPLARGTKNAPDYNQASRNLACIAFNTLYTNHKISFAVVAPAKKITKHRMKEKAGMDLMLKQIETRFNSYSGDEMVYSLRDSVLDRASTCICSVISYEDWIDLFIGTDTEKDLTVFYERCLEFNRIGK